MHVETGSAGLGEMVSSPPGRAQGTCTPRAGEVRGAHAAATARFGKLPAGLRGEQSSLLGTFCAVLFPDCFYAYFTLIPGRPGA